MDNIEFILSRKIDEYFDMAEGQENIRSYLQDSIKDEVTLAIRVNLTKEIVGALVGKGIKGTLRNMSKQIEDQGWRIKNTIVVFPGVDAPRFCFPAGDTYGHRMLFEKIFFPRNYSLVFKSRMVLRLYILILKIAGSRSFLYKGVVVKIVNEK